MKYDDKRPPAPRLMRPEDVNRAVRRTPPRKSRRSRPATPPPTVEEHKNNLNNVVKQSADKTRQKIEEDKARKLAEEQEKARKIQEEKERKEAKEKARLQRSKVEETRVTPKKVIPRTSTSSTTVSRPASVSPVVNGSRDNITPQVTPPTMTSSHENKTPLYSHDGVKKSSYDPVLENNKEKKEYDEIIADPSAIYNTPGSTRETPSVGVKNDSPKQKTSAPSPGELARTIENSRKNIKPKRKGINISVVTMSMFSIFLASSLSVLGAYSYGIYKDNTAEKVENAAYERGVQDATSDPTVETVMRVSPEKLTEMIMSSPNSNFPPNPVLTNFNLTGYSVPGGDEGRGRANVNFCYAADDTEGKRFGRAYFISDDANAQEPFWRVDAVNVTQDECK